MMRKELTALRKAMKNKNIDIYLIPTTDDHGSEYVNDHFKFREYVSGFTGSAGTLAVKQDFAGLWTDGRYFLQAEEQLRGTGIRLMKMGEKDVPGLEKYLSEQEPGLTVGFDGRVMGKELGAELEKNFTVSDTDLAAEIWKERPRIVPTEIYEPDSGAVGETADSKLRRLREKMDGADYFLVSRLEETAWLYNLRGRDIEHTPVFYSFALISQNNAVLYVKDEAFRRADRTGSIKAYEEIYNDLQSLKNCSIMLDQNTVSYRLFNCFDPSVEKIVCKSPIEQMKAVKNPAEIAATKNAHIRDGAAMVKFIYWLKTNIGKAELTEIDASDYLERCRKEQGAYDLSFTSIVGYEAHGAIVHYAAERESCAALRPEGFLLVDSGGQYEDGTTDITRTVALGAPDRKRIENYTAVLKANIALASLVFPKGTTGARLDQIARKPLQDRGLDFNHGTGHGVGHLLSVHEGPNTISPRGSGCEIVPGMITSDEPGVYLAGRYGIRLENEILCIEESSAGEKTITDEEFITGEKSGKSAKANGAAGENRESSVGTVPQERYAFETITFCPFEREAIDPAMLSDEELDYLNRYHGQVFRKISPLLNEEERIWLREACAPLAAAR